jgi:hypothetical protein
MHIWLLRRNPLKAKTVKSDRTTEEKEKTC